MLPKKSTLFDEDEYVAYFMEKKTSKALCCGSTCYRKLRYDQVRSQAMLLGFFKQLEVPDILNRIYKIYVMTSYMVQTNEKGNVSQYHLPCITQKICQKVWLELLIISRDTFYAWRGTVGPSRNILPLNHGLVGRVSNNYKSTVHEAVCDYVETVVSVDGHALPIHIRRADGQYCDQCFDTDSVIVLPPKHSLRSLHDG